MPRIQRVIGDSGFMHIIVRGINRQDLFLEDEDYESFLEKVKEVKQKFGFELIAYCLMTNHVHLVVHDDKKQFSLVMQSLEVRYSKYFNAKYGRSGYLFQDRFRSESIDTAEYLLTVIHYVHRNPEKAGMCKMADYRWSSYADYVDGAGLCDTALALDYFGGKAGFDEFHSACGPDVDLELEPTKALSDVEARRIICGVLSKPSPAGIMEFSNDIRDRYLKKLFRWGVSIPQTTRLTGLNYNIVRRAKSKM